MSSPRSSRSLRKASTVAPLSRWPVILAGSIALMLGANVAHARDLLRAGAPGGGGSSRGASGAGNRAGTAAAATVGKSAKDALARNTRALESMKKLQSQARASAVRQPTLTNPFRGGEALPAVPDGLAPGGLVVGANAATDPSVWRGAMLPTETTSGKNKKVDVVQTSKQAVLTWESFNIGKRTTLNFNQAGGKKRGGGNDWIAFNKVNDPTGRPSQILGKIKAQGAVYVINQNGIIFGGSSQINVHSLVASSLPINDNLIARGLLNNPDAQFLFSAVAMPAGNNGTPAFTPPAPTTPDGRIGGVKVEKGAQLNASTTADHVGGRVALIGPSVENAGTISTPDGQTILAAGMQVGFAAHDSTDASLRGLDVHVGAVTRPAAGQVPEQTGGGVINNGLVDAPRANVTFAGKQITHNGIINSTTSVSLNGRVDFLANYDAAQNPQAGSSGTTTPFLPRSVGTVIFGGNSVTQILPEYGSEETVVGTQLALRSRMKVQGRNIFFKGGSTVLAPNAIVTADAGLWKYTGGASGQSVFVYSGGQIYLGKGATINVAGSTGIEVPVTQNIITATLLGSELADSPLQRDNLRIRGQEVNIDIRQSGLYNGQAWVGSPLFNAAGYVGLIQRTVGQLTTDGGEVRLTSGGSVLVGPSAKIDASGGYTDYQGALVKTTRLVSGGNLIDISQATPDLIYEGIYDPKKTEVHEKYGIARTYTNPLPMDGAHWESGYVFGGAGGTVAITAPAILMQGELLGRTVVGPRQRVIPPGLSSLELNFQGQDGTATPYQTIYPTPPSIVFTKSPTNAALPAFNEALAESASLLPAANLAEVQLSTELLGEDGFGRVKITNPDGDVSLPVGEALRGLAGGSLTIEAANLNISGDIVIPSGTIALSAYNISPALVTALRATPGASLPAANPDRGFIRIGADATLSTAGLLVDDRGEDVDPNRVSIAGGTISLRGFDTELAAGSVLDVSGGLWAEARGRRTYGNAGSITLAAGQDLNLSAVLGGELVLGGTLRGYSGATGGSLSVQAPHVQIGGSSAGPRTLVLAPDFFTQGGFSTFSVTGIGSALGGDAMRAGLVIKDGTEIAPIALSYLAVPNAEHPEQLDLVPVARPEGFRNPVNLTLRAIGATDEFTRLTTVRGDLLMGEGSVIHTDARGSVTLSGQATQVLGSIYAPGGAIAISGANNSGNVFLANSGEALVTVQIGSKSVLSTAGKVLYTPDARGYLTGTVLPGGSITIAGNILAQQGAVLDVSGTSAELDVPAASVVNPELLTPRITSMMGAPMVRARVDSNGGAITFMGGQLLVTDATLRGFAGGPSAVGGSLSIASGRFYGPSELATPLDPTLQVSQNTTYAANTGGRSMLGQAISTPTGAKLVGKGYFAADRFQESGLSALTLAGTVEFAGNVSLEASRSLTVATAGVMLGEGNVELTAPYVALGQAFIAPRPLQSQVPIYVNGLGEPVHIAQQYGTGRLTVNADLIDIGNLALQKFGNVKLSAKSGDIRGNGTLSMAGNLTLEAGQVYAPTASTFTIAVGDYTVGNQTFDGSVTVRGGDTRPAPWSVASTLNIYASKIDQGGTLIAPFGTINLGWDGTGTGPINAITNTTVAASKSITLRDGSLTSVSGLDPLTGQPMLLPYGLNQNGTAWIDPFGTDITVSGPTQKGITIAGAAVHSLAGSTIDIRGGGDLFSYRWVGGIGGSRDILVGNGSFAVIPNYGAQFAPYAPFTDRPITDNLGTDIGYQNSTLRAGDQVYLAGVQGLDAGTYTLLPARYALLPGAFLVTPRTSAAVGYQQTEDGGQITSGYRTSAFTGQAAPQIASSFEVLDGAAIRARSQYAEYTANMTFAAAAQADSRAVPRLPEDAGHLILSATQAMTLKGNVLAEATTGGRGGLVDISSPVDIYITGNQQSAPAGTLALNAGDLSRFGAESLVIGGIRQITSTGTQLIVRTANLTVDNAGTALSAPDITLAAKENLTLLEGAQVVQTGTVSGSADTYTIGTATTPGSGNGTLLRVSSDPNAQIVRVAGSVNSANPQPNLTVGAGSLISGGSVILDSTSATTLDPSARIIGSSVSLNSGQISIELENAPGLLPTTGLVLSGTALASLQQTATSLSLLSYSTLDVYGTGQVGDASFARLALHAAAIRAFSNPGETATFAAQNILLDNSSGGTAPVPVGGSAGSLVFQGGVITVGENALAIQRASDVALRAGRGLLMRGTGGLSTTGNLNIVAPVITGARSANQALTAAGSLIITNLPSATGTIGGGLGARIAFTGATLQHSGRIVLPSGVVSLAATSGNLEVNGLIDAGGSAQSFFDGMVYTSGGQINLSSTGGQVILGADSRLDVSAAAVGNAGAVSISAPTGALRFGGTMLGQAGQGGVSGTFSMDVGSLPGGLLSSVNTVLDEGGFRAARLFRVRTGNLTVDGTTQAGRVEVTTDAGNISVTGTIDASGPRGGTIELLAGSGLTLQSTAQLSVAGAGLDASGQGGTVYLSTRTGQINLLAGSSIDLRVNSGNTAGGTLHLRAQAAGANFVQVGTFASTIQGARSVVVEGYSTVNAPNAGTAIIDNFKNTAITNANNFMSNAAAIRTRLLQNQSGLATVFHVRPGIEIVNALGDLQLNADWDLSTLRFGTPQQVMGPDGQPLRDSNNNLILVGNEPGYLTLRARGSITFNGSLTDGFGTGAGAIDIPVDTSGRATPWKQTLLPLFMDGTAQDSWSYRITAGADTAASDYRRTLSTTALSATGGNILLGVDAGLNIAAPSGANATNTDAIIAPNGTSRYQVIRTGAGSINITAARDVRLLNQFATIYTAGARTTNPTLNGNFDLPELYADANGSEPLYPAQFSQGGGNVTLTAGNDIGHYTRIGGELVADSQRQMPTNWLYRRGFVDTLTGAYGSGLYGDVASTAWWVDFSNFFQGVGALGGGNVTMTAGRDIANVDAVIPTNGRMPKNSLAEQDLVELGGGDLVVRAGRNIDAGVYYVEKGRGTLDAGGSIITNSTRTPSAGRVLNAEALAPETWLPTTLFLGKSSFDVTARGDLLLGPAANPFLLPGGEGNSFWYKSYFSTFSADSGVTATSLGGDVTLRQSVVINKTGIGLATPILQAWMDQFLADSSEKIGFYQPWLRINETITTPFATVSSLQASTLKVAALAGDINLVGDLTLFPAARGTLELLASGFVNGLQPAGFTSFNGVPTRSWVASTINVSDANPASVPGVAKPFAYQNVVGLNPVAMRVTGANFLGAVNAFFQETGATVGAAAVLQAQQALHAPGLLHSGDSAPVRVYARNGDVSGVTLFSPKFAQVLAGRDITDIGLYFQNVSADDTSVVSAGRDITAYEPNSPLRVLARSAGNALASGVPAASGDLQIAGPGALEALAGRHFDLGIGPNAADRTALGLVSIGNGRNPYLPEEGASVYVAAGLGSLAYSLAESSLDIQAFADQFIRSPEGARYLALLPEEEAITLEEFEQLDERRQAQVAVRLFYLVLRESGRDYNDPSSPNYGTYTAGFAAINTLFTNPGSEGNVALTSREIKTQRGGNISVLAPSGALDVGLDVAGTQPLDQGILTEDGGSIQIFAHGSVNVGTSRIFTLRGGDAVIWSSTGDIAAGASSRTVQSAPPTRVLVDPQTADVQTDLAGLATGGGIGVLATVEGVPPGNVDLIAPTGTIDAGDAGIRVTGNLNLAAVAVTNTSSISAGGSTTGAPAPAAVAAPNIGGMASASSSAGAANSAAEAATRPAQAPTQATEAPSIITVEVVGYGAGSGGPQPQGESNERQREEEERRRREAAGGAAPTASAQVPGNRDI